MNGKKGRLRIAIAAFVTTAVLPMDWAAVDVLVHRACDAYRFLHDNAVVWHGDTLFAAWYNCPRHEMQEASAIRGRRSTIIPISSLAVRSGPANARAFLIEAECFVEQDCTPREVFRNHLPLLLGRFQGEIAHTGKDESNTTSRSTTP